MVDARAFRSGVFVVAVGLMGLVNAHPAVSAPTDSNTTIAHEEGDVNARTHDLIQGSHVEGHIAFLKAELGITSAQQPLWEAVAAAMREDVRNVHEAEMRVGQQQRPQNALDYLQNRAMFAELRAQGEARFLSAFQPLYASFTAQQQQAANEILIPHDAE